MVFPKETIHKGSHILCLVCLFVPVKIFVTDGGASFVDPFCYLGFVFSMLSCLFIAALWSPAGKGLTSNLSCMLFFLVFCHFPMWCPWSGVVLDYIDS